VLLPSLLEAITSCNDVAAASPGTLIGPAPRVPTAAPAHTRVAAAAVLRHTLAQPLLLLLLLLLQAALPVRFHRWW
jgi:hypothetical protein